MVEISKAKLMFYKWGLGIVSAGLLSLATFMTTTKIQSAVVNTKLDQVNLTLGDLKKAIGDAGVDIDKIKEDIGTIAKDVAETNATLEGRINLVEEKIDGHIRRHP